MYREIERIEIRGGRGKYVHVRLYQLLALALFGGIGLFFLFLWSNGAPRSFPVNTPIVIEEGSDVRTITATLKEQGVIRSGLFFQAVLSLRHGSEFVRAGSYVFETPQSAIGLGKAFTSGDFTAPFLKVTIPEGLRGEQMVPLIRATLSEEHTATLTEDMLDAHIGYLFPDTYFISTDFTVEELVTLMQETFTEKIEPYLAEIEASPFTLDEVLILASIIEREADSEESMKIVSGILQDRLSIGMALQVDATFEYLLGKESKELTMDDLAVDSPYNTYTNRGLPPTPIANPGLQAIEAVLRPTKTPYLYYLTDPEGNYHYAETFEEHVENKRLYLTE